jgi:hypothetical protein
VGGAFLCVAVFVHGFLAVTRPIGRGILVVEAWIPDATLADSLKSYQNGSYRYLVVVGAPEKPGAPSTATHAAAELRDLGFHSDRLVQVDVPYRDLNRTVATAQALKQWLQTLRDSPRAVDVFTIGVHARKSWILFQAVLGEKYQVGVIAGPEVAYTPRYWMISRNGIWLVGRNLAGYIYAKLWILVH